MAYNNRRARQGQKTQQVITQPAAVENEQGEMTPGTPAAEQPPKEPTRSTAA